MELKEYFENKKGFGVLSTVDGPGKVNAAVYSRPHFTEDGLLAFVMRDRLTHNNLGSNPHAVYLFKEDGAGYNGRRLYLRKVREVEDAELIASLVRRNYLADREGSESRFLVYFKLEKELPLIGPGE